MGNDTEITPMMAQYRRIKGELPRDALLLFRLGDFYEMFFEDAHTAAKILDIALTSRNRSEESAVPLCGVPYHSVEPYIQKLLEAGHKVAVFEQVEDPALAKGVVKREVVRVITPGTVTAVEALDARGNNYLAAVCSGPGGFGLAVTDITTGEFRCTRVSADRDLLDELGRIRPSELLVAESDSRLREHVRKELPSIHLTALVDGAFVAGGADLAEGQRAASAIRGYLQANSAGSLALLRDPEPYEIRNYLVLDESTRANLELAASRGGERAASLLAIIDRTVSAVGARRMKQWLHYPLLDENTIRARHDGVEELADKFALRREVRRWLASIQDLERLAGRAVSGTAVPKDLIAIKLTLQSVRELRRELEGVRRQADSTYFGADIRVDVGDPTLGAVQNSAGTFLFAGLAYGRRVPGTPSTGARYGLVSRLGVRHAKLDSSTETDIAVEGGVVQPLRISELVVLVVAAPQRERCVVAHAADRGGCLLHGGPQLGGR